MKKIALQMKKIALSLSVLPALLLPVLGTAPAHAAYYSTWVSGTGDDDNSSTGCQQAAPCATFAAALSQVANGGEVNCAGPVDYLTNSTLSIVGSVMIDCHDMFASIGVIGGVPAITISNSQQVILRNLNLNGQVPQYVDGDGAGTEGILIQSAQSVEIDNCTVTFFNQKGIVDERSAGGFLSIKNTVVRDNSGPGIVVASSGSYNQAVLENVQSIGNTYGLAVGAGNTVVVNRSVMSNNSSAGVAVNAGGTLSVDHTEITANGVGVEANGGVILANSDIQFNTTGISGVTVSYGNNRIAGNSSKGTTPTVIPQQ
jgi:Right handed beta helix region